MENRSKNSKMVFVNPNFKSTHINPEFLKTPSTIHINPSFLRNYEYSGQINSSFTVQPIQEPAKIISNTRTKLIREPIQPIIVKGANAQKSSLIKIGSKKLVNASIIKKSTEQNSYKLPIVKKIEPKSYKFDRRFPNNNLKVKKKFISKYALSRIGVSQNLIPKMTKVKRNVLSTYAAISKCDNLKNKIQLVNINSICYKLTKNKLQRAQPKPYISNQKLNVDRTILVRGNKFLLDKSGKSLTRINTNAAAKLGRVDIGGLTYVEKSKNVFVRTDVHTARSHLSSAKQKSINVLSRSLVKSNLPCPIYRKVGKCAAFERGKCPKIHDKNLISICQKYLKGECDQVNCLLSHEVTLAKMPTCKFFLQGCCIRNSCPYLHKKINEKADICPDFLKGFCHLAENCRKRHDFPRTLVDNKVKSESTKVKNLAEHQFSAQQIDNSNAENQKDKQSRYFGTKEDEPIDKAIKSENQLQQKEENTCLSQKNNTIANRPKLGVLPLFIPL